MIATLRGEVVEVSDGFIIIEVQGVGYKVYVSKKMREELHVGDTIFCYTHQHVREDLMDLYGFSDAEQRTLFIMLISISGVGPRSALSVLDVASVEDLKTAIASDDAQLLKQVAGIGPKLAERITLELKNKLVGSSGASNRLAKDMDVIEGLISLGYPRSQAQEAVKDIPKDVTNSEERMKLALKRFAK